MCFERKCGDQIIYSLLGVKEPAQYPGISTYGEVNTQTWIVVSAVFVISSAYPNNDLSYRTSD